MDHDFIFFPLFHSEIQDIQFFSSEQALFSYFRKFCTFLQYVPFKIPKVIPKIYTYVQDCKQLYNKMNSCVFWLAHMRASLRRSSIIDHGLSTLTSMDGYTMTLRQHFSLLCCIKQIDSILLCICSVTDHKRHQNVVRPSVTHSPNSLCATFLFLPHFDFICDLLLNRCTATWNLFVKWSMLMT